jgi:hypothetical protein
MIQLFLRTRLHDLTAKRLRSGQFRVRSPERSHGTDRSRIEPIFSAIEAALESAQSEKDGLKNRIEDVLARASLTIGNATDEYLDREPHRNHHQDWFDSEMARGEKRTKELSTMIGHLKFLRGAMLSRFPNYQGPSMDGYW